MEKLKEETEIQEGQEGLFFETIRQFFYTSEGSLRPMNLQMIEHDISTETSANMMFFQRLNIVIERLTL